MRCARLLTAIAISVLVVVPLAPAQANAAAPDRQPAAEGYGGAISTVDPTATRVGLDVLRHGGNAVDAAVAAAATLGVTEPFSAGIGGGGFFVYYNARDHRVYTLDGREAAPASMGENAFVNPATGLPYDFQEARVSGISVGVPGTLLTWQQAARRWGNRPLSSGLRAAADVAERGFPVDATFTGQVTENLAPFSQFTPSAALYLPGGKAPAAGTTFRNPDLAATYRSLARGGVDELYRGPIGRDIVQTVQHPPIAPNPAQPWQYQIRPGTMTAADLAAYRVRDPEPTHSRYRGLDVYGMATPSSGGTAVGEALNILETSRLSQLPKTQVLHRYLEASALAFADRNRYVGDYTPRATLDRLLSDRFAATRACRISPTKALPKPVAPGPLDATGCTPAAAGQPSTQGTHTTNLTVSDRWGNIVEHTLTIEQTGGNAMVVPGRGFLLNNELTDFNFTDTQAPAAKDPNLPGPNKRPRSSISPTIILSHGRPYLALGSPGGSTIITTVLQTLVNRLDLGMGLLDAVAAPRATQRNTATVQSEQGFLDAPEAAGLTALGHQLTLYTSIGGPDIGAATAIEFRRGGQALAVAEPVRRGGGSAAVVRSCGLTGADQSLVQGG